MIDIEKHLSLFGGCYRSRRVMVTGHTGFKGSWLTLWLSRLGAQVIGYAMPPETEPNHWDLLRLNDCESIFADIRDVDRLKQVFTEHRPEIVFHLAAQPLVRRSYREPQETFSSNVIGTLNVMDAAKASESVRAIVCVTSDKVYENCESEAGYIESDRLGGSDPYSASKACAEILVNCYRKSYFNASQTEPQPFLATVRAGNVIGGGDWSEDRLIPDAVRAASSGTTLGIRNPASIRPWQHVLEPLAGYLAVGQRLLLADPTAATAWNFGPDEEGSVPVSEVVPHFQKTWPALVAEFAPEAGAPAETNVLRLDSSKAIDRLGWRPLWDWQTAVARTASWYQRFYESEEIATLSDLLDYEQQAIKAKVSWAAS
ncbi:CDP-glucose 4,6-dehydratase [Novipirellula aureliae]|uniref:CDP-glucose 4,6-dehydratase n=1 Tax=Novipirellula aureliae TaxID=2527966 RepID=A0A5C6E6C0_9BACT|nr:CDP-glucose 4,6-dehydratase [Novipirellula aureliae]TWU44340.1 CDP-glucose 4,6-dehydratase [Novipirellula aureliae]